MGDLGGGQNQGNGAVATALRNDVRSYEDGKSGPAVTPWPDFSECSVKMTEHTADDTDLEDLHEMLLDADVVEGPPGLKELVRELWPGLAHKVKPPVSEMH
jgi:hypothetical protein